MLVHQKTCIMQNSTYLDVTVISLLTHDVPSLGRVVSSGRADTSHVMLAHGGPWTKLTWPMSITGKANSNSRPIL